MHIPDWLASIGPQSRVWELALLAALACLGLGFAGAQNQPILGSAFAAEAGLAFIETFYLTG